MTNRTISRFPLASLPVMTLLAISSMAPGLAHSAGGAAQVTTVFECSVLSNGTREFPKPDDAGAATKMPCFYRVIATRCEATPNKPAAQSCRTDSLMEFELAAGAKKKVTNLPANFQYCIGVTAVPTVSECLAKPIKG